MGKKERITKDIITDKGEYTFEIRAKKEEGVALLTTSENENYLLLDSADYWYDLIQDSYPAKKKCTCKNDRFRVQTHYTFWDNSDDVSQIEVYTTCANCGKQSQLMMFDINYSPTDKLISTPLTFCEKPKIKYKYKQYTSFWTLKDLAKYLHFMHTDLKLYIYGWYFEEGIRYCKELTLEEAIQKEDKFLHLYFSTNKLPIPDFIKSTDEKGVYIKQDLWRKHEIIEISSVNMYGMSILYYTEFSEQYIDKTGISKNKSDKFIACTRRLSDWLKDNFINKRGTKAFDSLEMYDKFIAKQ